MASVAAVTPEALVAIKAMVASKAMGKLGPLALRGLEKVASLKHLQKGTKYIGNTLYGKYNKTARKLLKKGRSIAGVTPGKNSHNILKDGFEVGRKIGMISPEQATNIKTGHEKAMSFHDNLSRHNKRKRM